MNKLKLHHKLIGLSGLAMAVLALMTLVSYLTLEASDGTGRMVVANAAQRAQMDADMMHDAIRADVLLIHATANESGHDAIAQHVAAVAEHGARLRSDLEQVRQSGSTELSQILGEVDSRVQDYLREADAYARQAQASARAESAPPSFELAFSALEDAMERLGDAIDEWSHRINSEATSAKTTANRVNLAVALACGGVLLWLSLILVRSIREPLHAMAVVARAVSGGDVNQSVTHSSADELGDLADALRAMVEYIRDTARAAESLGHGDLTVTVRSRSANDTLSLSFISMKESLERLIRESNGLLVAARRGELHTRANPEGLRGAFQGMVTGMNALLEAVNEPLQEAKSVLSRVEARDLTVRMTGNYAGDFGVIKSSLNSAVQTLEKAIGEVAAHADRVAAGSAQITNDSASLASSASAQVSTIEQIRTELEQTTVMSKQSADKARVSQAQAEGAMLTAEHGTKNLASLSAAVGAMKAAADETAKIVRTIHEIASQTNLLALNAAVEAARSGDAGRGFAVVADEVRSLAMRSAEAARSTTLVIERSLSKAEECVNINGEATIAFGAIASQIKKVVEVMKEIAESSRRQHAAVTRVSESVESVASDAQTSASSANQAANAAKQLTKQAELMRETTSRFELELDAGDDRPRPESAVRRAEPKQRRLRANASR